MGAAVTTKTQRPTRVYIAAPYSRGIPDEIFVRVIDAAEQLAAAGYIPFIPHTMTFMWALRYQHPVEFWYAFDLHWLETCDALVRLVGESRGADAEVLHAQKIGVDVYMSLADLLLDLPATRPA